MFVEGLNHANLRVQDPEATFAFFVDVLGMTVKRSPEGGIGGGGMLLDANGKAILHVGRADAAYPTDRWRAFYPQASGGPVHHVALSCKGYDEVLRRLETARLDYLKGGIRELGLRQLFVVEPGGVLFELNFRHG